MNVIVLHGTGGSPEGNWFPWLKRKLESKGIDVIVPKMPTPEGQSLKSWLDCFEEISPIVGEDTIIVGHSLGANFILHLLNNKKIKKAILVSGFCHKLGNEFFDNLNSTFVDKEFSWSKIKNNADSFLIYHGDNDPYVPIREALNLKEKLGAEVKIIPNGGHLNKDAGMVKFDLLLREIEKDL